MQLEKPDITSPEYLEARKQELKLRVSAKRFAHSMSVAKLALTLAEAYEYPQPRYAFLAGIMHDWDKDLPATDLIVDARLFGMNEARLEGLQAMPWLLHGPVAALRFKHAYPEMGDELCEAVAKHTSASTCMTLLDMILYCADLLDPLRSVAALDILRSQIGIISLEDLYFACFKHNFLYLIEKEKVCDSQTLEIYNRLLIKRSLKARE